MKLSEVFQPTLYVAIGPSGAGKSTYFKKLQQEDPSIEYYSWDALRHEFYDRDNYQNAWKQSTFDKNFRKRVDARFQEQIQKGHSVYVDNTNTTARGRQYFLQTAKKLGYRTVGLVFNTPLDTILARQKTRTDKSVPDDAVRQQWNSLQNNPPQVGEFDEVIEVNQ